MRSMSKEKETPHFVFFRGGHTGKRKKTLILSFSEKGTQARERKSSFRLCQAEGNELGEIKPAICLCLDEAGRGRSASCHGPLKWISLGQSDFLKSHEKTAETIVAFFAFINPFSILTQFFFLFRFVPVRSSSVGGAPGFPREHQVFQESTRFSKRAFRTVKVLASM